MDWQPIETAPKDETNILCFIPYEDPSHNLIYVLRYSYLGKWVSGAYPYEGTANPSHWMPLPEPPK